MHVICITEPCCNKNGPASLIFLNEVHVALCNQKDLDESCIERVSSCSCLINSPLYFLYVRIILSQFYEIKLDVLLG